MSRRALGTLIAVSQRYKRGGQNANNPNTKTRRNLYLLGYKMNKPADKDLYERVKRSIYRKMKPSAYASGHIVQEYKRQYEKLHPGGKPYTGKKRADAPLKRWYAEDWTNERGNVGYGGRKDSIYRPNVRVNKKTPLTFSQISPQDIAAAKREKKRTGRVKNFKRT